MLVHHFLENSAEKYPHKEAVWYKDLWASFMDIEQNANRVTNFLIKNGISRGDRISLLMENSISYIICYFGILKAGAVVVAINNEVTSDNLLFYLNNSESSAIIAGSRFSSLFPIISHAPSVKFMISDTSLAYPPRTAYSLRIYCNQRNHSVLKFQQSASILHRLSTPPAVPEIPKESCLVIRI